LLQLPHRSVIQFDLLDILLLGTASAALFVTFEYKAPFAFIYTAGSAAGFFATAVTMRLKVRPIWAAICTGVLLGGMTGSIGGVVFAQIEHHILFEREIECMDPLQRIPRAIGYAFPRGAFTGGLTAALFSATSVLQSLTQRDQSPLR